MSRIKLEPYIDYFYSERGVQLQKVWESLGRLVALGNKDFLDIVVKRAVSFQLERLVSYFL